MQAEGGDELAELGRAFNAMAANLDQADMMRREMEQARRDLVAAISHALRRRSPRSARWSRRSTIAW